MAPATSPSASSYSKSTEQKRKGRNNSKVKVVKRNKRAIGRFYRPKLAKYDPGRVRVNFDKDLLDIMYGFGDNSEVDPRTVGLLNNIAIECMERIAKEALQVASARGKLDHECFIYILRDHPRAFARAKELLEAHRDISQATHQNLKRGALA